MQVLDQVEQLFMKEESPKLTVGETVRVHTKVVEGEKERIQIGQIFGKGIEAFFCPTDSLL